MTSGSGDTERSAVRGRGLQIFPDPESVIRLVGALLVEVNDELVAAPRRYMAEATLTPLTDPEEDRLPSIPAITA